ncbi:hypothetical protein [Comamonas composti]|uniref:hypothetical protein n=1 Tax=Comamonas composti TaxID=408558 RepID=UPI001FE17438|nr:hypothetical protein [Comamonas composti]
MFQTLSAWSAAYGGAFFLWIAAFCVVSYLGLYGFKSRLSTPFLRRLIRVSALIALPISWLAIQQGESHFAAAMLPLAWCLVLGITCSKEIASRR